MSATGLSGSEKLSWEVRVLPTLLWASHVATPAVLALQAAWRTRVPPAHWQTSVLGMSSEQTVAHLSLDCSLCVVLTYSSGWQQRKHHVSTEEPPPDAYTKIQISHWPCGFPPPQTFSLFFPQVSTCSILVAGNTAVNEIDKSPLSWRLCSGCGRAKQTINKIIFKADNTGHILESTWRAALEGWPGKTSAWAETGVTRQSSQEKSWQCLGATRRNSEFSEENRLAGSWGRKGFGPHGYGGGGRKWDQRGRQATHHVENWNPWQGAWILF